MSNIFTKEQRDMLSEATKWGARPPEESTQETLAGLQRVEASAKAMRKAVQSNNFRGVNRAVTAMLKGVSASLGSAIDDDWLSEQNARIVMAVRKEIAKLAG